MSLLAPGMAWLGLLLPAVVLLYLLKLRRTEVLVSSTFLWRKSLEDMHANAPFQKLVRNLLMAAQLLALSALVAALARPVLSGKLGSGRSLAVLIDTSASMQAADVAPSRLEAARAEALALVERMSDRDEMMLIAFDAKPRILESLTREKAQLRSALARLAPSDAAGSIREALLIASSVLRNRAGAGIVILSDGRCGGLDAPVDASVEVRYRAIGRRGLNAGITALDVRPVAGEPGRHQVFVETRRVGDIQRATLSLFADGGLVDARRVSWEGARPAAAVFEVRGKAETRLRLALDAADDLKADDAAYAVLGARPRRRILLVTEGNYFLERLLNLERDVDLFRIAPADFAASPAAAGAGDVALTVLDRWAPQRLPDGRYLLLGVPPPLEGFKVLGEARNPVVLDWKRGHPLMRFVNFMNLRVRRAARWECPPWVQPLLESSEGPLMVLAQRGRVTALATSFDLLDSDWPFRLSFPVFVSNAIRTLGSEGLGESRLLRPGDAVVWRSEAVPLPAALAVTTPAGVRESVAFHGEDTVGFAGTMACGFYALDDGKAQRSYGVSLRSAEETDTTPVAEGAFMLAGGKASSAGSVLPPREAWPWLSAAALALLCLEWAMYHRRWL